jgi:predicted SprT family Zn-dependent metalloprotease
MSMPKWAVDLSIEASDWLDVNVPDIVWRRTKKRYSTGRAWPDSNEIHINAGFSRIDARMVLLHELVHLKHSEVGHTAKYWDDCWRMYRWDKLPMKHCYQREIAYRKGAAKAYKRIKKEVRKS